MDSLLVSDFVCFLDNLQVVGHGHARVIEAGHAISTREAWLGIQDTLRKIRAEGGTQRPGSWAGLSVCVEKDIGVVVLTSQEKWNHLKTICQHWLDLIKDGENMLDFKQLRLDRGFMVYVTQVYPAMKPYLNGFHLTLENWKDDRDKEGWKLPAKGIKKEEDPESNAMESIKSDLLCQMLSNDVDKSQRDGPSSGLTKAVPRF